MVCFSYWSNHRGVRVTILNGSEGDMRNVVLKSSAGSYSNSLLQKNESFSVRVNPIGEADLAIEFTDAAGKNQTRELKVYFEHNYGGRLDVTIGTNDTITWNADIRL